MPNLTEATTIIKQNLPTGKIEAVVEYRNLYLFRVFVPLPGEEGMDPFYSVDKSSGTFRDFSLLTDGDIEEVTNLFIEADRKKGG